MLLVPTLWCFSVVFYIWEKIEVISDLACVYLPCQNHSNHYIYGILDRFNFFSLTAKVGFHTLLFFWKSGCYQYQDIFSWKTFPRVCLGACKYRKQINSYSRGKTGKKCCCCFGKSFLNALREAFNFYTSYNFVLKYFDQKVFIGLMTSFSSLVSPNY